MRVIQLEMMSWQELIEKLRKIKVYSTYSLENVGEQRFLIQKMTSTSRLRMFLNIKIA